MTTEIIIQEKISLSSGLISPKFVSNVRDKIVKSKTKKCTKQFGYILQILPDIKIVKNIISRSTLDVICTVQYKAKILKPKINDIFVGSVCMVFQGGILLIVEDCMKVLIPITNLHDYTLNSNGTTFVHDDNGGTISIGSQVQVKVTGQEYNPNTESYSCYGSLVPIPEEKLKTDYLKKFFPTFAT